MLGLPEGTPRRGRGRRRRRRWQVAHGGWRPRGRRERHALVLPDGAGSLSSCERMAAKTLDHSLPGLCHMYFCIIAQGTPRLQLCTSFVAHVKSKIAE